ncbi:MAG TPA: glycosyltransferase 87 family protein [Gaiellaceae bacterium]|nr:glycosyltransferase 87 family protein [Gaiellaceae bacterium]
MAPPPKSEPGSPLLKGNWGGPKAALAALLGIALGLRIVGLQYGLPFGTILDPDEQSIVPRAWRMVHGFGLDPHWFDYPTLVLYVEAPFQAWDGSPSILTARIVIVAFGLAAVAATWWLGRKAYDTVAAAVGAAFVVVQTTSVAYSHTAVTDVPLEAGIAASLALMVSDRLAWAGVAAGLATSAKYPGVFLLVPLVVAGWGRWRRLATSIGLGALSFLATSPFVLVHPLQAWSDASRVQRLARDGWLGFEHDSFALFSFTGRFWHTLGPALIVAIVGLVVAAVSRKKPDLILVSFVLVYFVDLLTIRAHFDRYLLPLVPVAGVLAGRLRALAPVTLLLLAVPLTYSVRNDIALTKTDTRIVAERWIESHIPQNSSIAAESSTPPLAGLRVLPLLLPGPGRPFDPNRNVSRLRTEGIRYVLVTGAVADRVLAARKNYPREARFYDQLRRHAIRLYYVKPVHGLAGPWVAVYRL